MHAGDPGVPRFAPRAAAHTAIIGARSHAAGVAMGSGSGRAWWSPLAWRRQAVPRDGDFADHGTAFGLDASLARPHEPSSRYTGMPAASDFLPGDELQPEPPR